MSGHRGKMHLPGFNPNYPNTAQCGAKGKNINILTKEQFEDFRGDVDCKKCNGEQSALQRAAYLKKRMRGNIAMARHCLHTVSSTVGIPVDDKNLDHLFNGIDKWYDEQKVLYGVKGK